MENANTEFQDVVSEVPYVKGSKLPFTAWIPGVFIHPVKLFRGIKEREPKLNDWLLATIGIIVLSVVVALLDYASASFAAARLNMDEGTSIGLREYAFNLEGANAAFNAALSLIAGPAVLVLNVMAAAAVIWVLGRLVTPKKFNFKASLSIVGVIQLVTLVEAVALLLIVFITGEAFSFRFEHLFQMNSKSLADQFIGGLQPIEMYKFAIVIIGLSVFGGMKKMRALITGLVLAIVIVLAIVLLPLLG